MYRRSPGRREGRPFGNDYGPGHDFDSEWRVPEMHGPPHWDEGPHPREGPEGDWGRPGREDFMPPPQRDRRSRSIEDYKGRRSPADFGHHHRSGPDPPPGYLERRRLSPSKNFHEEMRPRSPRRRGSRDNAPSPLTFEHSHQHSSPGGWGRDGRGVNHPDRQEGGSGRGPQGPRGYSPRGRESSRAHDRRPQDRMEHGRSYQEEHNQAAYRERSAFSDRSQQPKRSEFRDRRPQEKHPRDSWSHYEEEEQKGSERPYVRSGAPLIVEHDHGISHHEEDGGDRDGRERHHQAPLRHHGGPPPPPDRHRRHEARDEPPMQPHAKRRRNTPPPPLMSLPRRQPPEIHGAGDRDVPPVFQKRQAGPPPPPAQDVDLRPDRTDRGGGSTAFSGKKWEQKDNQQQQQRRKAGPDMGPQRPPFHPHRESSQGKHSNRDMPSTSRADPSERETLKIRVDMSRPMGQDRYGLADSNILSGSLGYSSDRQLSLDLVNVGRQRLDFLPMLEHSGSFRETPLHTGTFAQEIITLVHQVKEMYFKGYNTTLNERFSSVMTDGPEPDEDAVADRRIKVSVPESMPLFSKIGNPEPQRRPQAFDPGDLRHDLERRRQERLEGVKITISGASFPPMPDSVENEMMFEEDEREREMRYEDGPPPHWDDEGPGDRRDWGEQPNDMRHRMPWSGRRNRRRPFRSGPQSGPNRRQYHNSANGGDW